MGMSTLAAPSPPFSFLFRRGLLDYLSTLVQWNRKKPETRSVEAETRLVERMARGNADALREVHEICAQPVFGYLCRFLGDRATAEDVQQQVFIEAWEKADRFDGERGSLMAWVMTIARSRAIDHSRRRVPEPRDPQRPEGLVESSSGGRDEIEEVVETWQFAQILAEVPSDEAEVLRFRFQDELSQTEISAKTGIPLGTVKSRMVSGMERLRVEMGAESE
ncbi:MAG: sigma-70 family RNA polymerase sigma factor [Thermoleophilia bacterium]|nr:sigma-70 family RNA polymerase sigma factor [Thermoleophilia bacterium]